MKFVYGSSERIFVNTSIGCKASCKYCYLPKMQKENSIVCISGEEAVSQVNRLYEFERGENGTIISIGCYSECLDEINKDKTRTILEQILPLGNYVQLATKQYVGQDLIDLIREKRCFEQQISIYISMPTISRISEIEEGTINFEERINNIKRCIENNIKVVLYIKPFLGQLTLKDINIYSDIIKEYKLPVVIGPYLTTDNLEVLADVGEKVLYERKMGDEYEVFIEEIRKITSVAIHSTELIKQYRKERGKNGKFN